MPRDSPSTERLLRDDDEFINRRRESDTVSNTETDALLDPNLVWWDKDNDAEHPYNWPRWRTQSNCFLISAMTFLTALASSIIAPGVPQLMTEFQTDNLQLAAFVVSVYILGFAAGPLFIAPLSEIYGRVIVYHFCNIGFTVFAAGCALAPNIHTLIVFRFLNGLFGSCPATIGGGSITDMIPQNRRASVVAAYSVGALFAPIIGPLAGGLLAGTLGWRWDFWLLTLSGGVASIFMFFMLKETYHPVILERKAARLRTESDNTHLRSKLNPGLSPRAYFIRNIIRPLNMLMFSPIIIITSLFIAITYGYMYLLFTSFTQVFGRYYGFTTNTVGFCFLGLGIGSFLGVAVFSGISDRIMKAKANADSHCSTGITMAAQKNGMRPEYRLPPLPWAVLSLAFGLLMYGWTAELRLHWIFPIIGTVFIGLGQLLLFMVLQMYLIDAFTIYAASAVAAITAVRSIAGALLPLLGLSLYDKLGIGWGNTVLAVVCLPLLVVSHLLVRYGEALREKFEIKNL
ncbi:bicyclomycin resistance protein [Penicillium angulare]|uniref:Bicyclomycin resistance protein n=1 Tax=Penicillium angulare TaxID=116970 RepID=A0A9W9G8L6_9EURO|nr:bicyclomycin resistance protein [Penicillium angulare]